jgi:hypothetical protein
VFTHSGAPGEPQSFGHAPATQAQWAPEQVEWFWQALPQVPQWLGSTCRSTQGGLPPQSVAVPAQRQPPPEQVASAGATPAAAHAVPQVLQLSGSTARSTQAPGLEPQVSGSDAGHAQVPALHRPSVGQRWPQAPQLRESAAWTSTQAPLQQLSPAAQAWPHAPQLARSLLASRHVPPHLMRGAVQLSFDGPVQAERRAAAARARTSARFMVAMIARARRPVHPDGARDAAPGGPAGPAEPGLRPC